MTDLAQKLKQLPDSQSLGEVVFPGDDGYEESLKRWSATCVKPAAVVVMPSSTAQVSNAVKFAVANSLPFTVCCGGHSTSGQSSLASGMVIDLRRMRSVSVDPAARTITFAGGCLWSDVDAAAWAHGLATPGGTVNHTGVGGLILGGGFGFLTPRVGLTIDVLLSLELVLADGTVVTASATSHPDLFWAARGAGTSFGIATRFTSRAFPQGRVWAGPLVFPPARIPDVVRAANAVLAAHPRDATVLLAFSFGPPPERLPALLAVAVYTGDSAAGEAAFAPLLGLGPLEVHAAEVDYPVVNTLANGMLPHGPRYQFGAANVRFPIDAAVVQAAADEWFPGIAAMSADPEVDDDMRGSFVMFEGLPYGQIRAVAPDATAHANRGEYFNVAVGMRWENPKNDEMARAFKKKVAAIIREKGVQGDQVGGKGVGQYNNYIEEGIIAERAFGGNAKRLKELKAKYDPDNRFDKLWKLAA